MGVTNRELGREILSSPLGEHLSAIGALCMSWSLMEAMLGELVRVLLNLELGQESESVSGNIDCRDQVQIALAVGFLKKIDDKWFEELKIVLDLIDNDLRNKRNRYVHDLWTFDVTTYVVQKVQWKTVIKRPQARKALELTTLHKTDVSVDDVWSASNAISDAAGRLALLAQQHGMVTRRLASRKKSS